MAHLNLLFEFGDFFPYNCSLGNKMLNLIRISSVKWKEANFLNGTKIPWNSIDHIPSSSPLERSKSLFESRPFQWLTLY